MSLTISRSFSVCACMHVYVCVPVCVMCGSIHDGSLLLVSICMRTLVSDISMGASQKATC